MLSSFVSRAGSLEYPTRLLFIAIIIAAVVQLLKHYTPRINGWVAVIVNVAVSLCAISELRGSEAVSIPAMLLVALAAAGIHGTATKLSDHPGAKENPTPSGYDVE
jgi:hypothetical protein